MSLGGSKPKSPPPPPSTPTQANASTFVAGTSSPGASPGSSLISTGPTGLQRKAKTQKRSLIGAA